MLRSANDLMGYTITASDDDDVGKLEDILFEDRMWRIRYMVGDVGGWLSARLVLLPPQRFGEPDRDEKKIPVSLTRDEVEGASDFHQDPPVSHQQDRVFLMAYGHWTAYWPGAALGMGAGAPGVPLFPTAALAEEAEEAAREAQQQDRHLRSAREVKGYHVHALDGEIGKIDDFIVDTEAHSIRYVAVDTNGIWPGGKVLVSPDWLQRVDWSERMVHVDLKKDRIKDCPPYDPGKPVNLEYEKKLYDYYGREHPHA